MVPEEFSFLIKLNNVKAHLRREMDIKPAGIEDLVNLELDDLDQTINPAIVLAVSRSCGEEGQK